MTNFNFCYLKKISGSMLFLFYLLEYKPTTVFKHLHRPNYLCGNKAILSKPALSTLSDF